MSSSLPSRATAACSASSRSARCGRTRRLCTSTLKRDKIAPLFKQITDALGLDGQTLILSALEIRAAESPRRARELPLALDARASTGQRTVLPWPWPWPPDRRGRFRRKGCAPPGHS